MCWDCYAEPHDRYKEIKQGGVDPEDFYMEVNYSPKRKSKKKREKKKYPGCPGNEGKAHIYVWTTEREFQDLFYRYFGFSKYQSNICVGCGKRNGVKNSDKYEARKQREWDKRYTVTVKRGEPVPRYGWRYRPSFKYWQWENELPEYREYRREYISRYGYNQYVYGF